MKKMFACLFSLVLLVPPVTHLGTFGRAKLRAVPACGLSAIFPWASMEGGGTAGSTYYSIELSNIGPETCTLVGFPGIIGYTDANTVTGLPAAHTGHPSVVILAPMATAHVLLRVTDVGALGCPTVGADTLIVRPPGYPLIVKGESDQLGFYPLRLCTNKVTMSTTPVELGTGIPAYSS